MLILLICISPSVWAQAESPFWRYQSYSEYEPAFAAYDPITAARQWIAWRIAYDKEIYDEEIFGDPPFIYVLKGCRVANGIETEPYYLNYWPTYLPEEDAECYIERHSSSNGDVSGRNYSFKIHYCNGELNNSECTTSNDPFLRKNVGEPKECGVGNPINPGFGNKFQREKDYDNGNKLAFNRYYDSALIKNTAFPANERIGINWRHSFDRYLIFAGTNRIYVMREDGKALRFTLVYPTYAGIYTSEEDVKAGLREHFDENGRFIGWRYVDSDNKNNIKIDIFDLSGRLVSAIDGGYRQTLTYSDETTPISIAPAAGLLIKVVDSFNRQLAFTYDSQRRINTMTDPAGGVYRYTYDTNGNLVSVTAPDDSVRKYLYEDFNYHRHALTGIIDENNQRFATWSYDEQGRAISSDHGGCRAERVSLSYNADGSVTVTDALNTSRTYSFQTAQNVTRTTSISTPDGAAIVHTYDGRGNVSSKTDRNGNKTCYAYNELNFEIKRIEGLPANADCASMLNAESLPPSARRVITHWSYYQPTTIFEPGRITGMHYDRYGNMTSKRLNVDGNIRYWEYAYNEAGQLLTATDPRGGVVTNTYDSQGNLATATNPAGHVTTYSDYDAHGRVGKIIDPNGLVITMTYHTRGWVTSRMVGSETTSYDYDGVGQVKKITLPDGSWTAYTYDDAHRLTSIADNLGNRITYTLDLMGNRISEEVTDPDGALTGKITRVYDELNHLKQITGVTGGMQ